MLLVSPEEDGQADLPKEPRYLRIAAWGALGLVISWSVALANRAYGADPSVTALLLVPLQLLVGASTGALLVGLLLAFMKWRAGDCRR